MIEVELPNLIPTTHGERLQEIVSVSWRIFQSHFMGDRYAILKEAPFQHHFANILSTVGTLYCISREERFFVDLEAKSQIEGKLKFIDIACGFSSAPVKCAIEVKFKTAQQGAQDHGRIDAYVDIAALEHVCKEQFYFGRFFMITNSSVYINQSKKGVGTIFCTHHQHVVTPGVPLRSPSKGREGIEITLRSPYRFHWTKSGNWYFLEIQVQGVSGLQEI